MRSFLLLVLILPLGIVPAYAATVAPLGQSGKTTESLFETQRGYFHPSVSVSEVYTDNLFNTQANAEEEYITILTPGIWLAFPGLLEPAEPVYTDTTAAGGLSLGRFGEKDDRPFQSFLNYEAGIKRHKNFDNEDITTHRVHALARGTLTSGFSLEASDVFNRSHDAYATGISTTQNRFDSNLAQLSGKMPISERFGLRLDYSNFQVDYDELSNDFRDRTDNTGAAYIYYGWSRKTRFFVQYSFLDIAYDTNVNNDNTQQRGYLGIDYHLSEKLKMLVKAGVNNKNRDKGFSDRNDFIYELQADYQFTQKNNLNIETWRKLKESDTPGANGIMGYSFMATYSQLLGQRMVASLQAGWTRDDYDGVLTFAGKTDERSDDYLIAGLTLGYAMQKWFEVSCGYNYVKRDSNFDSFDYKANSVFLNLTGKL